MASGGGTEGFDDGTAVADLAARRAWLVHAPVSSTLRAADHTRRCGARIRGESPRPVGALARKLLGMDALLVPVQPDTAAGCCRALRAHSIGFADLGADRRSHARRRTRASRRACLRVDTRMAAARSRGVGDARRLVVSATVTARPYLQ